MSVSERVMISVTDWNNAQSKTLLAGLQHVLPKDSEYNIYFIEHSWDYIYGESSAEINPTCLGLHLKLMSTVI
jgi:hypothetical protein